MKSVLISIKPEWCAMIASSRKTIEVRKTKPKCKTPFKCYIYCSKNTKDLIKGCIATTIGFVARNSGKVIGEFVCDNIDTYDDDTIFTFRYEDYTRWNDFDLNRACIHPEDFQNYSNGKWLYGWHISDLVIYDKPKELSEFYKYCGDNPDCNGCEVHYYSNTECGLEDYCCSKIDGCRPIKRPPQSWCYVEEAEE